MNVSMQHDPPSNTICEGVKHTSKVRRLTPTRRGSMPPPLTCCMPLMAAGMLSLSGHHCLMHASAPFERIVRGAWAALRGRRSAHAC